MTLTSRTKSKFCDFSLAYEKFEYLPENNLVFKNCVSNCGIKNKHPAL